MTILKSDAITLRAIDWSETSQIAWFFTREFGRVHLVAKGARRARSPFEGAIEPLVRGEIVFYRKRGSVKDEEALEVLKEFDPADSYPGIRRDLSRLYRGTYVIELLRELSIPDEPMRDLFDAACLTLDRLARGEARVLDAVLAAFELRALRASGLEPSLLRCVECGAVGPEGKGAGATAWFGPIAGGLLCREHRSADSRAFEVPCEALRALAVLASDERPRKQVKFGKELVREVRRVLDAFIAHGLGKELKLPRSIALDLA